MSQQPLDLTRSMQVVWRHKTLVGIVAALGLVAGVVFAVLNPSMLASQALVVLPPYVHDTSTQDVIATSDPVLSDALRTLGLRMSTGTLRRSVTAGSLAYNLISITAQGKTAVQAERTANAVARSYVDYLSSGRAPFGSEKTPFSAVPAQVLQPATDVMGTSLPVRMLLTAGPGTLGGLLAGLILALAIGRSDVRLRGRDEIAEAVWAPVLASLTVSHSSDPAGWRKLLEEYQPGAVDAWRLRKILQHLGLADSDGSGSSLAVLSLSCDRKALAVGPQLAVCGARLGIPTALVIGPQQDANATAVLRAACTATPQSGNLRLAVRDHRDAEPLPDAKLTVVVAVVDGATPKVAETMRTSATVLGVSSGAATAEQLARVAASAAADGRHIAGILVADPDPADHTTGSLPQLARPAQRTMQARTTGMTGTPTGTRL